MARPASEHPTPAELEVLRVLWDRGPLSVRGVMEALGPRPRRAYTSVMSLLDVMHTKGLLRRKAAGRAFIYEAKVDRPGTLGAMVRDLAKRAFDGSAAALVAHLLRSGRASPQEFEEIQRLVSEHRKKGGRP